MYAIIYCKIKFTAVAIAALTDTSPSESPLVLCWANPAMRIRVKYYSESACHISYI